jgi:hypothetical protein
MKYLWVHRKNPDCEVLKIIDNPIELFKTGQLNEAHDSIYQIGNQVKLKVILEPVSNYRFAASTSTVLITVTPTQENKRSNR